MFDGHKCVRRDTSWLFSWLNVQADFEDSLAPTFTNLMEGHVNLRDAVRGSIDYEDKKRGKRYSLKPNHAVLLVRPRGWHLVGEHNPSLSPAFSWSTHVPGNACA